MSNKKSQKPTKNNNTLSHQTWGKKTERFIILGLVLISLIVRVQLLEYHSFVTWDGANYINYFHDSDWQHVFPPGYSMFVELFHVLVPDNVLSAQWVSLIFGSLLPIPLFYLARFFLSSPLSLIATIIAVFNPLMIRYGAVTMSEMQYIFFELSAFYFYFKRSPVWFGILSGIAYLTRPEALVFFGILFLYELFRKHDYKFILSFCMLFALIAVPYVLYLKITTGTWSLTPKTQNVKVLDLDWRVNVSKEKVSSEETTTSQLLESVITQFPSRFWEYSKILLKYAGIPLVAISLYGIFKNRNILLAGLMMFLCIPLFGMNISTRFVLPFIPFLVIFAMLSLENIKQAWLVYLLCGIMLVGVSPVFDEIKIPEENLLELREAGLAIHPMVHTTDILLDRKPYTAFYAGGRYRQIPNEPLDTIMVFARRTNARFLVMAERVVGVFRPQLQPLLYDENIYSKDNVRSIYSNGLKTGYGLRIVELM